nr:hypothetical protein [Tanacetum cinerariifolium]
MGQCCTTPPNVTDIKCDMILVVRTAIEEDPMEFVRRISAVNGVHRAHMPNGTIWVKGMVSPDAFDAALYTLYENPPIISGSVSLV